MAADPSIDINNPPSAGTFPTDLRRWTDFQRVTLALGAVGLNAQDFNGRDVTAPFSTFAPVAQRHALNRTILADIFAIIALNTVPSSGGADLFLASVLGAQRADGSWSLNPAQPASALDLDITAMSLQALAPHYRSGNPHVVAATYNALGWLHAQDFPDPESTAQMIVALTALGDAHAAQTEYYILRLLQWYDPATGGFILAGQVNPIATVQAAYALVAYWRFINGMSPLFETKGDFEYPLAWPPEAPTHDNGVPPGRHTDMRITQITNPGITFADIQNHANRQAIESLAERGIINGRSETHFEPDATITRAEFAAIVTRGLGLPDRAGAAFDDVPSTAWFATAVGTAFYYEIIAGLSPTVFNPTGTLTRQEAAVMIARAARLCGLDTNLAGGETLNILAMFGDYQSAASWAWDALAFCFREGILDDYEFYIQPTAAISRGEVAEMLHRLLYAANLV